jgi:hypothetical protein
MGSVFDVISVATVIDGFGEVAGEIPGVRMEPNGISGLLKTSGHGNNLRVGAIPTYVGATRRRYRVSSGSLPSEPA